MSATTHPLNVSVPAMQIIPLHPFAFDDFPIFTLTNAIAAMAAAVNNLLGDQTTLIQDSMGVSANLVGPMSQKWSDYWQSVLKYDEEQIAGCKGNQQELATWTNQFNVDNSSNSATTSGFGSISSMVSQQISSMTSNFQNISQMGNTVVTGLYSAMIQDWVL